MASETTMPTNAIPDEESEDPLIVALQLETLEHFERVVCDEGVREGSRVLIDEGEEFAICGCTIEERMRQSRGVVVLLAKGHAVVNVETATGAETRREHYFFVHAEGGAVKP